MRLHPVAPQTVQVVCVLLLILASSGCAATLTPPPKIPGVIENCTVWNEACRSCGSIQAGASELGGDLVIGVMLHVMLARGIEDPVRKSLAGKGLDWMVAPTRDAVLGYWTPTAIDAVLGPKGTVNHIWKQANIRFSLIQVDTCAYESEHLRLDGRRRESMFTPESHVPWAADLFRSINRLFTSAHPYVIHVLVWWSIREDDVDPIWVQGYARSAAYGGPVVWADAYQCFNIPDEPGIDESPTRDVRETTGVVAGCCPMRWDMHSACSTWTTRRT